MTKEISGITIRKSELSDIDSILGLIAQASDALLTVSYTEITGWINSGHSIVAVDDEGNVVGHQGLGKWPVSGALELRAAYMDPSLRGKGINTLMKEEMMQLGKHHYPGAPFVGFTEAASKSRGILLKLGFTELPMEQVPEEMFSVCPENCFKKTGLDCGCKVFFKK